MTLPTGVRLHWREAGDPAALFPDTRGHGLSQKFERAEDYTFYEAIAPRCSR